MAPLDPLDTTPLRRCALAVSVIDGIDLTPGPQGVHLDDVGLLLRWSELGQVVGELDPESSRARRRLRWWLGLRGALHALPEPADRARPVGLPRGHPLHPGRTWVRRRVLGGCLDLGTGFVGLLDDPDEVIVAPPALLQAAGVDDRTWWPRLAAYLEQMARVAVERYRSDPTAPLRPIGDCDVVTLLGSPTLRAALTSSDPVGLRTAAVPMRRRGWLDLSRIDPAFAVAAAAATDPVERGFARPVLITSEEVTLAGEGGDPATLALLDPVVVAPPWLRV